MEVQWDMKTNPSSTSTHAEIFHFTSAWMNHATQALRKEVTNMVTVQYSVFIGWSTVITDEMCVMLGDEEGR